MSLGIILVHGYTGKPSDLQPLADHLVRNFGADSVTNLTLPGHDKAGVPAFDKEAYERHILSVARTYQEQARKLVLLGHSTGGILALSTVSEGLITPDLVILAGVPNRINSDYQVRWGKHRAGKETVPFIHMAKMVSLINAVGPRSLKENLPVLIIHGEDDDLVPAPEASAWKQAGQIKKMRRVIVPGAGHDLFLGTNSLLAMDIILRAISDIERASPPCHRELIDTLSMVEPEIIPFLKSSPSSKAHLVFCPSGQHLIHSQPLLEAVARHEPVFANIEITTQCNMRCTYCARTLLKRTAKTMSLETFRRTLEILPHAYRITLVGLGEPLLHPNIVDMIAEASALGRRTALVTNAMYLDPSLSSELISAGLQSIAFSIDGPNQEIASSLRPGTDLRKVIENIRQFVSVSEKNPGLSKAVFSAVSIQTVHYLEELIDLVSQLGVDVLMLTDLNYEQNAKNALWKNVDRELMETIRKALRYGFSKKFPVLSVHGLEEFGLAHRYKDFLLIPPDQLYRRSIRHQWCFSPWQTVPIDVEGNVTVCDCQPENRIGDVFSKSFSEIWNGGKMQDYRRRMLSADPPETCTTCPRF